jgi:hypothetical protein
LESPLPHALPEETSKYVSRFAPHSLMLLDPDKADHFSVENSQSPISYWKFATNILVILMPFVFRPLSMLS